MSDTVNIKEDFELLDQDTPGVGGALPLNTGSAQSSNKSPPAISSNNSPANSSATKTPTDNKCHQSLIPKYYSTGRKEPQILECYAAQHKSRRGILLGEPQPHRNRFRQRDKSNSDTRIGGTNRSISQRYSLWGRITRQQWGWFQS